MVKILGSRRGMTLVEAMMTVVILGIIFGLGSVFFNGVNKFYYLNRARGEVQRDARMALSLINRNLRQAQANTISISQGSGQPPYSKITFTKIQGQTMSFYQQGNRLIMQNGTHTRVLAENLRYIAFTFPMSDDMSIVSISLTMEKGTYQGMTKAMHLAVEKVRVMN